MMNPQDKLITQECFRRTKYGFPKNGQFFLPKKPAGWAGTKKAIRGAGPRIAFGFEKQVGRQLAAEIYFPSDLACSSM